MNSCIRVCVFFFLSGPICQASAGVSVLFKPCWSKCQFRWFPHQWRTCSKGEKVRQMFLLCTLIIHTVNIDLCIPSKLFFLGLLPYPRQSSQRSVCWARRFLSHRESQAYLRHHLHAPLASTHHQKECRHTHTPLQSCLTAGTRSWASRPSPNKVSFMQWHTKQVCTVLFLTKTVSNFVFMTIFYYRFFLLLNLLRFYVNYIC